MTYGQWSGQDGQRGRQEWPGADRGAVPPQWQNERKDSIGVLGWYGQRDHEERGQPAGGNEGWQPQQQLDRGSGRRAYVPQQAQRFLPTRPRPTGQRGFDPPSPQPPRCGPPQPPYRPQPPRGRSWPTRRKALTGVLAFTALATIVGAARSGMMQAPVPPGPAPTTAAPALATPAAVAASPTSVAPASCHPLANTGNCYEPGEYCRDSDRGASGVTSDGEPITCEYNYGWRWEPS
jgi:hypothetical protein